MASIPLSIPTNKRLVIPAKFLFAIPASGDAFVEIPFFFSGTTTHLTISSANADGDKKGKCRIEHVDNALDIFRDPRPGDMDVLLDYYTFEMRLPINGNYKLHFSDMPTGDFVGLITFEERPRRV